MTVRLSSRHLLTEWAACSSFPARHLQELCDESHKFKAQCTNKGQGTWQVNFEVLGNGQYSVVLEVCVRGLLEAVLQYGLVGVCTLWAGAECGVGGMGVLGGGVQCVVWGEGCNVVLGCGMCRATGGVEGLQRVVMACENQ